jgi:hypothetical protein
MPQLQNLVVNDRAATPVAHTFVPRDITDGVATVEESTGVPVGTNTISASLRKTTQGNYKATLKGKFPIVQNQTINGIVTPVVVRTAYAELMFTFSESSSEQERKDCVGMMADSLAASKVLINDTVVKLQGIY